MDPRLAVLDAAGPVKPYAVGWHRKHRLGWEQPHELVADEVHGLIGIDFALPQRTIRSAAHQHPNLVGRRRSTPGAPATAVAQRAMIRRDPTPEERNDPFTPVEHASDNDSDDSTHRSADRNGIHPPIVVRRCDRERGTRGRAQRPAGVLSPEPP